MTISDLGKSFGAEKIFEKINAKIEDRDRIALIGPNGAGKTTLLNPVSYTHLDVYKRQTL